MSFFSLSREYLRDALLFLILKSRVCRYDDLTVYVENRRCTKMLRMCGSFRVRASPCAWRPCKDSRRLHDVE